MIRAPLWRATSRLGIHMIELVFLACLTTMPDQCQEKVIKFLSAPTATLCLFQAQPELASWANTHPGHSITRWRCRDMSESVAERNDPDARPPL